MPVVHQCADGYIVVSLIGSTLSKMVHWRVADGIVPEAWIEGEDWPIYERKLIQREPTRYELNEVVDAVRRFLKTRTKCKLMELG